MMLIRAELSCMGWPDGSIPHGHVDVKVRGESDWQWDHALDMILCQINRDCYLCYEWGGDSSVDFDLLEERRDGFDWGKTFAIVVGGEGDALAFNPIGTTLESF